MARTPYNDPEAEKQYQDNSVDTRNQDMPNTRVAGTVSNWPYSQQDININKASSDIVRQIQGPSQTPAQVIQFPVKKRK